MIKAKEKYQLLVQFLGQTLGDDYEIVLHWRDADDSFSIIAIEHGNISGRTVNSPVTGFALELIKNRVYVKKDYISNYKALTDVKRPLSGSTFFIKDEESNLLGLLCINFDSGQYLDLAQTFFRLSKQDNSFLLDGHAVEAEDSANVSEVLSTRIEDIIEAHIDPAVLQSEIQLSVQKKIAIVSDLKEQGIFQLKGAIPRIATLLQISEPSVYRYLHQLKQP